MRRVVRALGALALVAGVAGFATTLGASAQTTPTDTGQFTLSARADSLQIQIVATGLPVVTGGQVAAASPSSAQATVDTSSSQAYASAPYPGDLVVSLPSTVNGLSSGQAPPLPPFPFYVATSNPTTTSAKQEVGPYSITAASSDNASSADAKIGLATFSPQVVSATSHAAVTRDPSSGLLTAEATTEIAPFRLNNLLTVGDIRGDAKVTYDPNSKTPLSKTSSLSIGTITIAGIELGLTDKGLSVAGKTVLPVDLSALQKLLGSSGFSVSYAPKIETANSVTSAGLILKYHTVAPDPINDATLQIALGQVTASVAPGQPLTADQTPDTGGSGGTGSADAGSGSGLTPTGSLGDTTPIGGNGIPVPSSKGSTGSSSPQVRRTSATLADTSSFYLILVVGGLVALACSRLTQWAALRARLAPALSTRGFGSGPEGPSP